ncbi:SipW-dependent-type signal peptide-containing protein [Zhihengliuella halotolerans]|uniref:Putative ribosomally synthesized peptide with SipW-like signal peptide n=1 Tax=Zhihengliuella halotolerans TaxID=370736 RepID=A0A4Q8ABE6_9MICC|nr:SipW-dependent-type signal peptide-containing protein [Zhihengliuella halotolerans]RZU60853.1 putative ribosomally synthesized peptide with SipW-like signal peptide [Zhihengliuella halotolerans]
MTEQMKAKKRAVLAGGLVLGIGAAVTLAAWTDSEFGEGLFTAGSFNLEGSDDGVAYAEHETADGALQLTFSDLFDNLTPSDTTYAAYWLRLDSATTTDGTLTPAGAVATDVAGANAAATSYTITEVESGDCEAGTATGPVIASGATLNDQSGATSLDLVSNGGGTDGTAIPLCFAVTAGDEGEFEQGGQTSVIWQFDAESE